MTLDKDGAVLQAQATSQVEHRHLARLLVEYSRVLGHGQGMQVHDAEDVFILMLFRYPILDSPQIVANGQVAGGLDSGKDSLFLSLWWNISHLLPPCYLTPA